MDVQVNPGPPTQPCKKLSICHVNIRSLSRSKLRAIQTSLYNFYDIITLSETHLHAGVTNDLFQLEGYHDIIRKDRADNGGGVAIFIKENISFKRIFKYESKDLEALWIQLQTIEGKVLLCCCYRPPDQGAFWDLFNTVLDDVKSDGSKYMFILGDINADPNTANGRKLHQLCMEQNLDCMVKEPTRITNTSATILDQIITNAPNFINNVDVTPPISTNDHCTISARLNFKIKKECTYSRIVWQYNQANFDRFQQIICEENFDECFETDNVDQACEMWTEKFLNIARSHIPNKVITVRPNDSPWYTNALRLQKRKMLRLFHKFKGRKTSTNWEAYAKARSDYQKSLDDAELKYKESLSDSLKSNRNSKTWWKTVKGFLGKGGDTSYPSLNVNDRPVTDNEEKASEFNKFFLSHSDIDLSNAQLPNQEEFPQNLAEIRATEREVHDLIKCIDTSKATGPDGISPKLLHEAGIAIVPSLTKLINLSLSTAKVPLKWKQANVIPIFKKGEKSDVNNYRPVSLLSCVNKIMEKIVFKHVYNYIRDNNLISSHQSGFKPGDSTVNQLSFLYHTFCEALDKKKEVHIVFCDISKAFDRVWHDGLLFKLQTFGIYGNLLQWFGNYLSERQQRVIIRGQQSDLGLIKAGVPQGSNLGPLLFLIYIDDLTRVTQSKMKLFADDTSLYIEVEDPNVATETLNEDLSNIQSWADQWLVKFSPTKTKLMTASYRNIAHAPIRFNNTTLAEVNSHKHLGLVLSSNMTWTEHITHLIQSTSHMCDVMKHLKYQIDRKSLETIYHSFIRPKLEYASQVWDNCTKRDCDILENLQLSVARTVTGARKGTSHQLLYRETNWPTLEERRQNAKPKHFLKISSSEAPNYLIELLPEKIGERRPNSRNANDYIMFKTRTETFRRSFIPSAVKLYNSLDPQNRCLKYCNKLNEYEPNKLFFEGNREVNIKHAQLRMKCSKLNYHLFLLHVTDSPACPCGFDTEDANHYLLHCPLYLVERQAMWQSVSNVINIDVNILLFGSKDLDFKTNQLIFAAVHMFIKDTKRL